MTRGEVWEVEAPGPRRRPVVIVTRAVAIPVLATVTVAAVTTRVRSLRTEVALGPEHGLAQECVVNCDNLFTVPKTALGRRLGTLGPIEVRRLDDALRVALELD